MEPDYVHGYSAREQQRLADQAATLMPLLHSDTRYAPGALVLEPGCGTGAQTVALAANSPGAAFTSADISEEALATARRRVDRAGLHNVKFRREDVLHLSFEDSS